MATTAIPYPRTDAMPQVTVLSSLLIILGHSSSPVFSMPRATTRSQPYSLTQPVLKESSTTSLWLQVSCHLVVLGSSRCKLVCKQTCHTCTCMYMYMYMYVHVHVYVCTCTCIYIPVHVCLGTDNHYRHNLHSSL